MDIRKQTYRELVDTRFPGLTEKIKKAIEESERAFDKKPGRQESFLWEHTIQVASISQQLAELEKIDPLRFSMTPVSSRAADTTRTTRTRRKHRPSWQSGSWANPG